MQINIHNVIERAIHTSVSEAVSLSPYGPFFEADKQELADDVSRSVMNDLCDIIEFNDQYFQLKCTSDVMALDTLVEKINE
jgi:hypothetical protein